MIILNNNNNVNLESSRRLTRYCFRDNSGDYTSWYLDKRLHRAYAMLDDHGGVAAQVYDSRMRIRARGRSLPASMISHVAVDPNHRSKGLMNGLMPQVLRSLRSDGVALAALYPSSYSFYERYGFTACGPAARVIIPLDRLKARPLQYRLNLSADEKPHPLADCYTAAYGGVSGSMDRLAADVSPHSGSSQNINIKGMVDRLDDLLHDGSSAAHASSSLVTLTRDDTITGYWIKRDEGSLMIVDEAVFRDGQARLDFLSCLASHASTTKEAHLLLPAFEPLLAMLPDRYATITIEPWAMFRALSIRALADGMPAGEGRLHLRIIDNQCDDNDGLYTFESIDGTLSVTHAVDQTNPGACSLTVNDATAWLLGSVNGSDLLSRGRSISPGTARSMDALLPTARVFLWEQC